MEVVYVQAHTKFTKKPKMKTTILVFISLIPLCLSAQALSLNSGTTRAVIIGVSDYQNKQIPDLRYANVDAEAFANYLKSPAGGALPENQIQLLLNEKATAGQVAAALYWMIDESKEGDVAIIYFSGHGDVERKLLGQPGFLLCWDAPPKIYLAGGTFGLSALQSIVSTLSVENKAKVVLITDACRAGKLAGNEIGGAQATTANLAKLYANELKILSCQPNEFSLEGEQWGGGRGAFSYHLIEGLSGLADRNDDLQVSLFEIGRYLEDKVSAETAPHSQMPFTVGDRNGSLALVDKEVLEDLKARKEGELLALGTIETRGFEESIIAQADTTVQEMYNDFLVAIEQGNLLAPKGTSANDYYEKLIVEESLKDIHGFMKRNFAAVLQDDAQQAINAYLMANPGELKNRYDRDPHYNRFPKYLSRAAELLGTSHVFYKGLKAKQLYFEGLGMRLASVDTAVVIKDSLYNSAIEHQLKALSFEKNAPYIFNELGVLYSLMKQTKKSFEYLSKAIEASPEWGLPYVNYCIESYYSGDREKAIEMGEKGLERMPDYPQMYNFLGWIYSNFSNKDKSNWTRRGIELKQNFFYDYIDNETLDRKKKRLKRTIELLQAAIELDSNYLAAQSNLALAFVNVRNYKAAVKPLEKAIQIDSTYSTAYARLGSTYFFLGKPKKGTALIKKAISMVEGKNASRIAFYYNILGNRMNTLGKLAESIPYYKKAIEFNPNWTTPKSNLASCYDALRNFQKAEHYYIETLNHNLDYAGSYKSLGRFYRETHRWEEAEWLLKKSLDLNPDFAFAIINLIDLYQKNGQSEKAQEWIDNLLSLAPEEVSVHLSIGGFYYLNKEYEKVEKHFKKADDLGLGEFYLNQGVFDKAEKYLELGKAANPNKQGSYLYLAFLHNCKGEYQKAQQILEEGENEVDLNILVNEMQTVYTFFSKSKEDSERIFQEAAKDRPVFNEIWNFLNAAQSKDFDQAQQSWEEISEEMETWYLQHIYLGALVQNGNMDEALEYLLYSSKKALNYELLTNYAPLEPLRVTKGYQDFMRRNFPERFDDLEQYDFDELVGLYYPDNCIQLAKIYERLQANHLGKQLYEKALMKTNKVSSKADSFAFAEANLKLGRFEEARRICPDSLANGSAQDYFDKADLYYRRKEPNKAKAHFEKYIEKASDKSNAFAFVGQFYMKHADFELVNAYSFQSLQKKFTNQFAHFNLVWAEYSSGSFTSLGRYNAQVNLMTSSDQSIRGLQLVYQYFSNSPKDAELIFTKASEADPGYRDVFKFLEAIRLNQFKEAIALWSTIEDQFSGWWLGIIKPLHIGAHAQVGNFETAFTLMDEGDIFFLNYGILHNHPLLEPLRDKPEYQAFILRHFPEKIEE